MESSPLIHNGNSDGEHYLKPDEGEEPSSTLLNVSQDEISEIDSKKNDTNEAAIHGENEDDGMKYQTSTSCEKHSEETLPTTSSDTIHSLDNTHGSHSVSEGSDETEISDHAPAEAEIPNINAVSLEHSDDKSKEGTEKDEQKSSTHIEGSSLEGFDENPHDAENYDVDTQQNESLPIEANENKNLNDSF
ncbi:hypothetical protein WA026_002434 [Henosepilachna vigintioctopunctata]|uniref:Uncharacterized protein n=1 Tax=Henosepilachna vigintioctopunctata TaxID=420089 RepID=A0AAW1TZF0_9CUCU